MRRQCGGVDAIFLSHVYRGPREIKRMTYIYIEREREGGRGREGGREEGREGGREGGRERGDH